MKWNLKLNGVFIIKPEENCSAHDMSEKFIDSFKHIGELVSAKYNCTEFKNGLLELVADIVFTFESDCTEENEAVAEFMTELEYMGEPTTLDYKISRPDEYTATYLVYLDDRTDMNVTAGPYKDVESLKEHTMDVLSNVIGNLFPDRDFPVDATIEHDGEWYDSDSFIAVYKDGKVIKITEG